MRWQIKPRHEGDGKLAMAGFLLQQSKQKLGGCSEVRVAPVSVREGLS